MMTCVPDSAVGLTGVRVLLVRHGETCYNARGICQGRLDIPMSARGEEQVLRLKKILAPSLHKTAISAAYSSPLGRAQRTLEILIGESSIPLSISDEFAELDYGEWQGTSFESWPTQAKEQWELDPWSLSFPNGESLPQVQHRVLTALSGIAIKHSGQTIILSSHGHVNRVILLKALGLEPTEFWSIKQHNADAWWVDYSLSPSGSLCFTHASRAEPFVTQASAQRVIDSKTKPIGSLGCLEEIAVKLAVLQQTLSPAIEKARICTFGADHGIALEGVSAYPREVTIEMMRNFSRGGAAINVLAAVNGVDTEVIDVGVDGDLSGFKGVRSEKVRNGSQNFLYQPAITHEALHSALEVGRQAVQRAVRAGMDVIGLGEMGIGNTTSAAALLSALTGHPPSLTVGAGTGVSGNALENKRIVVEKALALHGGRDITEFRRKEIVGDSFCTSYNPITAFDCLRCYGGLEIAAMAGAAMEATRHPIAVLADGFISTVAVLAGGMILKEEGQSISEFADRLFVSHRSTEAGYQIAVEALSNLTDVAVSPLLALNMRLGEGTGAALAVPLLRSAAAVMSEMATFSDADISAGTHESVHGVSRESQFSISDVPVLMQMPDVTL